MNKVVFYISLFVVVAGGITSCKTSSMQPDGNLIGYDYYPIQTGFYTIYNCYDTTFTFGTVTDSTYQLKELVADTLRFSDELVYRLERYTRSNSSMAWPSQPDSVWTVFNSSQQIIKYQSNVRFIKLVFPVAEGTTWNGNALNTYPAQNYVMRNVGKPYIVNNQNYPSTLRVIQSADTNNYVSRSFVVEVYAKGVGLIYKENQNYTYDTSPSNIGLYVVSYGRHTVQKIIQYGNQ